MVKCGRNSMQRGNPDDTQSKWMSQLHGFTGSSTLLYLFSTFLCKPIFWYSSNNMWSMFTVIFPARATTSLQCGGKKTAGFSFHMFSPIDKLCSQHPSYKWGRLGRWRGKMTHSLCSAKKLQQSMEAAGKQQHATLLPTQILHLADLGTKSFKGKNLRK